MDSRFTIIIPTLASRPKELERAIASLLGQTCGKVIPFVVVNGDGYDPDLVQHLRETRSIRFLQITTPNVSRARYEGRKRVDTEYFGFLDDDDEYLPDGLRIKHDQFERRPDSDVVVGNGWHTAAGTKQLLWQDTAAIAVNPAEALISLNWLASCSALFKTQSIEAASFDFNFAYFEWTYLAMNLALKRIISFAPEPTFVIHSAPNSASDSEAYRKAYPDMLSRILEIELPRPLRCKLHRKLLAAHHNLSEHYRCRRIMSTAWKHHLHSMLGIHGILQYSLFTRRLLSISPRSIDPRSTHTD